MNPQKQYKDSVFRRLFSEPKNMLAIFNAIEGTNYSDETQIKVTTLENVFFNNIKNDVSFKIADKFIILNEHQSTLNQNMPLRFFLYAAELYRQAIEYKAAYRNKLVNIPAPRFYTFYNGEEYAEEKIVLKLSDAYAVPIKPGDENYMDICVHAYNINYNSEYKLLKECQPLREYSMLIATIRKYNKSGMNLADAIREGIQECRRSGILEEFLKQSESEVMDMLNLEWDMDTALKVRREEGIEEGFEKGRQEGVLQTARNMLRKGLSVDVVAEVKSLPQELLRRLAQDN